MNAPAAMNERARVAHVEAIARDGYTIVEGAIEPGLIEALNGALDRLERDLNAKPSHNTFEGVAFALATTLPGVDYEKGMALANKIDSTGLAIVWSGHRELAELYHSQLEAYGLTLAPLER